MGVLDNQKWSEEQFAKEMKADLARALDMAARAGETVVWPVASPVGEGRTQAVEAQPDGSWRLVDHVDREGYPRP
jgi:hypothetical protein